jgi:hypothetical protein
MNNSELDELKQEMRNSLDFGRCFACGREYPGLWPIEELDDLDDDWRLRKDSAGEICALECGDCPEGVRFPGEAMQVHAPRSYADELLKAYADELLKIFKMLFLDTGKIPSPNTHKAVLQAYLTGAAADCVIKGDIRGKSEIDAMMIEIGDRNWQPYGKFL